MAALQTTWAQYAQHSLDVGGCGDRSARLEFARTVIGRKVESYSELTHDEASKVLDRLRQILGQPTNRRPRSRMRDRRDAREAGLAGRRGDSDNSVSLVSAADLARIDDAIRRLKWTRERFDAWLRSSSSPIRRPNPQIRTVADANRVWWPLKAMLKRAGKWRADDDRAFVAPVPTPEVALASRPAVVRASTPSLREPVAASGTAAATASVDASATVEGAVEPLCPGCGYPVAYAGDYCSECLCEDDGF